MTPLDVRRPKARTYQRNGGTTAHKSSRRRRLRRGRPLHLDEDRMKQLADLWAKHAIAREVVHERIMRDRVVREAYY